MFLLDRGQSSELVVELGGGSIFLLVSFTSGPSETKPGPGGSVVLQLMEENMEGFSSQKEF